ncbi:MAG: type IV secretion system protein [Rickettsiales bacterium]|nr:type IV secretion system protein [Rickettsiales bacterium]
MLNQGLGSRSFNGLVIAIVVLALVSTLFAMMPDNAYANDGSGAYSNVKSKCQQIRQQVESSDIDKAWLTEYIVKCVKEVVREVFTQFINGFYPHLEGAIAAALTLAVTLFGALILTQQLEKPNRDTFVTLVKLASVLYFVKPETVTWLFESGLDAMDGLTDLVFQFGKGANSPRCIDNATVFDRIDCMLDVLIGIVKPEGQGNNGNNYVGISRGLLFFFASSMFSKGGAGMIIGLVGFYTVATFTMATIKSIHTYLSAIVALSFILCFAPLFVPMLMFKVTRTYFDKWHKITTAFILQPVILFGFLSFMMIAMDKMLLSEDGFMGTVFGPQSQQKDFNPNKAMETSGGLKYVSPGYFWGVSYASATPGLSSEQGTGVLGNSFPTAGKTKSHQQKTNDFGKTSTMLPSVDFSKMCQGGGGDAAKCTEQSILSAVSIALTAFVFISILNYIPNLATDLSGGIYEVPNLFNEVGSKLPGMEAIQKEISGATNGMTEGIRSQLRSMVGRR